MSLESSVRGLTGRDDLGATLLKRDGPSCGLKAVPEPSPLVSANSTLS